MDHNSVTSRDATIDALRGSALPFEQARQSDDVAAMLEAFEHAPSVFTSRRFGRRGAAIAMVTLASLGAGGVLVAGPGTFLPAADTPAEPVAPADQDPADPTADDSVERHTTDADVTCAEGNHGRTVSSVAQAAASTEADVSAAAESLCGKPITADDADEAPGQQGDNGVERHATDPNVTCAEGNHGKTVSSVAQAGGDVTAAAHSQCGKPLNSGGPDTEADENGDVGATGRPDDPGSQAGEHPVGPATPADPATPAVPPTGDGPATPAEPASPAEPPAGSGGGAPDELPPAAPGG